MGQSRTSNAFILLFTLLTLNTLETVS